MRFYFLVLVFMVVGAPVFAEVFPLTFEVPPTPDATFSDPINQPRNDGPATYQRPKSLKQPPRLRSKRPLFFTAEILKQKFLFIFDESKGTGKGYDTLIADANGDGNLANDKSYHVDPNPVASNFYAVRLTLKRERETLPYALYVSLTSSKKGWFCESGHVGYWKGTIKAGNQVVQVRAFDVNGNGRYNDNPATPEDMSTNGDLLLFNWNGKRMFPLYWGLDFIGQTNRIALGGQFYEIQMQPSGRSISTTLISPQLGTIRTDSLSCRIRLHSEMDDFVLDSKDGEFKVPTGTYQLITWQIDTTDKNGASWNLQATEKQQIIVRENETVAVSLLSSLAATVVVHELPGLRPQLVPVIKRADGGEVFDITRNGKDFIAPIEIVNATGKTVLRLQFPHNKGPGFPFWYWEPAQGMNGKFRAVPDVAALPFKVEVQPSEEFQIGREEKRPTAK